MRSIVKWNLLVLALAAGLAIGAPLAHADTFDWTITGADWGSGTFSTASLSAGGTYLITGITGTYDGSQVALNPAYPDPSSFDYNDNLLYAGLLLPDGGGISFSLSDGDDINLADATNYTSPAAGDQIATQDATQLAAFNNGTAPYPGPTDLVTLSVVPAPEPSSIALMLLGVGGVLVMRKRIAQGLPQAS